MNERIRELESQCWEPRQYGPAWFDSEKFAELIIHECCQMMIDLERKYPANLTVKEIKDHFGIDNTDTTLRNRSTYFSNSRMWSELSHISRFYIMALMNSFVVFLIR